MYEDDNIYARLSYEFEVIGIFDLAGEPIENPQTQEEWDDHWRQEQNLNRIFIPNWIAERIFRETQAAEASSWESVGYDMPEWMQEQEERPVDVTPIFILEDPLYVDDFRAATADLLPRFHVIEDLSSAFDDIASSMDTMQNIANWILYVSIGATLLILSLLITLFLRDRRYEMGVYLALGEKKGKIISQILVEVVVTALVGITLAVFTGNIISNTMSRNILRNELASQSNQDDSGGDWTVFDQIGIPTTSMSPEEMMEAFEVSLSVETVGLFYVIGLGAVVLSTLVPVIYVVTLNPKKVLM